MTATELLVAVDRVAGVGRHRGRVDVVRSGGASGGRMTVCGRCRH
jgi:hypothetical protein